MLEFTEQEHSLATDACKTQSTTTRTVRWTQDLTPPVFTGAMLM